MFSHWSKTSFELEPRNYKTVALDRLFTHGKPHGLWFDVDGDWQRWCEAEGFATDRFEWRHVLTLDMSRMIQLRNADEIDEFTRRYTVRDGAIDWPTVTNGAAGLVIAPYCWERRLGANTDWYYGWDCASGCVWDLTAVLTWTPMKVDAEMLTSKG